MKRSNQELNAQVKALEAIKPTVRHRSAFGDDHHAAIEAQIDVIVGNVEPDDIDEQFWPDNVTDAAWLAQRWTEGEDLEDGPDPASTWKSLVR